MPGAQTTHTHKTHAHTHACTHTYLAVGDDALMSGAELALESALVRDQLAERRHDDALDEAGQDEVRVHDQRPGPALHAHTPGSVGVRALSWQHRRGRKGNS